MGGQWLLSVLQPQMLGLPRTGSSFQMASSAVNAEVQGKPSAAWKVGVESRYLLLYCLEMAKMLEAAKTASGQGSTENATS